jgi:phosphatidylinositol-3-phosphatase
MSATGTERGLQVLVLSADVGEGTWPRRGRSPRVFAPANAGAVISATGSSGSAGSCGTSSATGTGGSWDTPGAGRCGPAVDGTGKPNPSMHDDRGVSAPRPRAVIAATIALALLMSTACGRTSPGKPLAAPPARALPSSPSSHVAVIAMENKEASDVVGTSSSPYVTSLAHRYATATRSYAIRHPSLPNYLALTSGATQGVTDDCTDCHVAARNIVDQLEAARISWKAYMEDLPAPCSPVAGAGGYAKKHDPFMYYDDIARNPRRCRNVVGFDRLASDLRRGTLPTFAFISPNLCHDTHDCSVATGDRFLAGLVPRLLREAGPHGFVVLTWDEGASDQGCCVDAHGGRIATIVAGPDVRRHGHGDRAVDHYGVLRTVEHALGLRPLGGAALRRSGSLDGLLIRPAHVR